MRKIKLITLLAAALMTANMWATQQQIGSTGLYWEVSGTTLTITYSGSGSSAMPDYAVESLRPWHNNRTSVTSIVLPNELTYIGRNAFKNFSAVDNALTIPSNVIGIGLSAFHGCSSIPSFTLNEGLQTIANQVFQGCSSLESIVFPASITNVGSKICQTCTNLVTLEFLGTTPCVIGTEILGGDIDYNCPNFEQILVPDAASQAYANAWLEYWEFMFEKTSGNHVPAAVIPTEGDFGAEGNNLHWSYAANVLTITGSGSTGGLGVLGKNQPWKLYNADIQTIYLPDGITYIGSDDFCQMTNVDNIHLSANPEDLTWEEDGDDLKEETKGTICIVPAAYLEAYNTKFPDVNVTFSDGSPAPVVEPNGITWNLYGGVLTFAYDGVGTGIMEDYATMSDQPWADQRMGITQIVLAEGITHIGKNAFNFCNKVIEPVTIPSTVTSIGNDAFTYCIKLPSVTLNDGLKTISEGAFMGCYAFESITIPASVTEIGLSAFSNCNALAEVNCSPTTAPNLGNNAFYNHPTNLVINYPNGSDQDYANKFLLYWDCLRNAATGVQPGTPHLHGVFGDADLEWDLSFTGSGTLVEHEGTLAITGEGAMDDYDWPNNVWAPWMTYADFINHVNIGNKVTKIGESAFAFMKHVNTFIIPASVTYIGGDAFMECDNTEMIVYCFADPENLVWHDNVSEYEGEGWVPDDFLTLTRNAWGNYEWHVQATKCVVPSNYLEGYKAKWARGGDYKWWDLNVWFTSELQDGESAEYINNALNALDGKTAPVVTLVRPLNRDGYFATLCLPFDMSAEQLAESSLHGAEIKEFTNASVEAGTINIEFTPVDHIVAGKPYFIKYEDTEVIGDALDRLDFMNVTIDKTAPVAVTHNGVTMTGTFVPKYVAAQTSPSDGDGVLFLGPSNQLFWPSDAGNIKPFRAYFSVAGGASGAPRRGMPVRIVERENAPTGFEAIHKDVHFNKTIENGMLMIEKNGVRYNAQGQIVK